jgi:hypothetical protein
MVIDTTSAFVGHISDAGFTRGVANYEINRSSTFAKEIRILEVSIEARAAIIPSRLIIPICFRSIITRCTSISL